MERLESKWIRSAGRKSCAYETHKSPTRLGLRNMRDGLILVVFGIIFGGALSAAEIRLGRSKERQSLKFLNADSIRLKTEEIFQDQFRKREMSAKRFAAIWLSLVKKRRAYFHFTLLGLTNPTQNHRLSVKTDIRNQVEYQMPKSIFVTAKKREIFAPNLNFKRKSCRMYCSRCHNAINTIPRACVGRFTVVASAICIVFCLWPCAVLPFFLICFADYAHYCPIKNCGHKVGQYCRFRKPQFYV